MCEIANVDDIEQHRISVDYNNLTIYVLAHFSELQFLLCNNNFLTHSFFSSASISCRPLISSLALDLALSVAVPGTIAPRSLDLTLLHSVSVILLPRVFNRFSVSARFNDTPPTAPTALFSRSLS